jgi:hypothetical protein
VCHRASSVKTTLLAALLGEVAPSERIVCVEDAKECQYTSGTKPMTCNNDPPGGKVPTRRTDAGARRAGRPRYAAKLDSHALEHAFDRLARIYAAERAAPTDGCY